LLPNFLLLFTKNFGLKDSEQFFQRLASSTYCIEGLGLIVPNVIYYSGVLNFQKSTAPSPRQLTRSCEPDSPSVREIRKPDITEYRDPFLIASSYASWSTCCIEGLGLIVPNVIYY
jgi:hypothetical protein